MPETVSANRIEAVCAAAGRWREQLVDTSGRNRLRNYRDLKTGTLDLTPDNDNGLDADALDQLLAGDTVPLSHLFPPFMDETDAFDDARKRVSAISKNARSDFEEKGIDTLFAAIGLATWKVEQGATPPNAPVLLAPLEIEARGRKGSDYTIAISGDVILNPVLTHILEQDHGVDTGPVGQQIDADGPLAELASFGALEEILADIEDDWSGQRPKLELSIEPRMVAGIFRYASQAMVEDLKRNCERFAANDLIAAIAGDGDAHAALAANICNPPLNQPDRDPPADEFIVLKADSSQHRAINRVLGGESLVIKGPPGTGKSQTIANLIATLMARGKRVLFVAEKRAAIEAVTKRLGDDVGLADLVMDIHGGIKGKRQFAEMLKDSLKMVKGILPADDNDLWGKLENRRETLIAYEDALHRERDPWGLSAFEIQKRLLAVPGEARTKLPLSLTAAKGINSARFNSLASGIGEWVGLDGHALATEHPEWSRSAIATPNEASEAFDLAYDLDGTYFPVARDALFATLDEAGLARPNTVAGWQQLLDFVSRVERMLTRCLPDVHQLDHGGMRQSLTPQPGTVAAQALRHLSEGPAAEERSGLELAVRLTDELLPAAREALERTLGEVGGSLPDTLAEWRETVEFLLAIERTLTRCQPEVYRLDHTALRESLTVGIGMADRVVVQLSMQAPDERREGHDLAARMAALLPEACEALFTALDEVGLTRTQTISKWSSMVDLLSDIQEMQSQCPTDIYRRTKIERKKVLPPEASGLMGILKSIFSKEYRAEREVRDDMLQEMDRHDEKWAEWSTDGLHPRLPANLKGVKERIGVLADMAARLQRLVTTDTFADVEHDELLQVLSRVNEYWNAREALLAALREPEELSDPDAFGLLDEVEGQIEEWGQRMGSGEPRVPGALTEANERLLALTDGLAAFTRMASVPSFDQEPHDNLRGALEALKEHWTTRETITEMLRAPGYLSAADALDLVREAGTQLEEWRRRSVDGGEPRVPDGLDDARERVRTLVAALANLGATIKDDGLAEWDTNDLAELLERLASAESRTAAIRLPHVRELEERFREAGIDNVLQQVGQGIPAEHAADAVEHAWLQRVLNTIWFLDRRIGNFDGGTHSGIRDDFIEFDRQHIRATPQRVKRRVAEAAIDAMNQYPGEHAIVRTEANKKAKLKPVRRLFEEAPHILAALRPCWTMSPILVAEMIPANSELFDVVIFDEASQIQPAEAIGSLARAPQAVIAGDDQQLPPTPFFGKVAADDDDDEDDDDDDGGAIKGMESILGTAGALALRDQMLQWHYRSHDDRLIAFSNQHWYGSALTAFPGTRDDVPVLHHRVDKPSPTRSSNPEEVQAVVDLVLDHVRERPDQTLGVIAFGQPHATAIENELANRRLVDANSDAVLTAFEAKMDKEGERLFVKNIERVQGDERDAIILSVGYSRRQANGKIAHNFGPINQNGGERRLNVAITRAREHMTLVSTFDHRDMNPRPHAAQGVDRLHQYFEYVASGCENAGSPPPEMNPFELSIRDGLERRGIPVTSQYGVSGYRIDFACAHPDQPGRMVLAIEADGASYHSTPTARDRDRLRQQVLEDKGWRFHRIWSTAWFRDREAELDKAEQAWRDAVAKADAGPPPSAPPPEGVAPSAEPPPEAPPERSGPRPNVPRVKTLGYNDITHYHDHQLEELARWIDSDGLLRTDEQLMADMQRELGFRRRGKRIEDALTRAIRRARR